MALERYSSIDQANDAAEEPLGAAAALDRMLELVSLSPANRSQLFESGIYLYRTLDEAGAARETATETRMRSLRASRSRS